MSYRLTRDRPLSRQLPRLLHTELAKALELLAASTPDADAIHESRKSLKKARALLRLVKQALGDEYHREEERLRVAAHAVSVLRDADASLETLEMLRGEYSSVMKPAIVRAIAGGLRSEKRATKVKALHSLPQARVALEEALGSAPGEIATVARFNNVRSGVVRGYRRAKRAFRVLDMDSGVGQFHFWRRRVKDHWYQVRLFEGLHSAARVRAGWLTELEGLLGDDHNLALLRDLILTAPDHYGGARDTAVVLGCILKRQYGLRDRALARGGRLFDERSGAFESRVVEWWGK